MLEINESSLRGFVYTENYYNKLKEMNIFDLLIEKEEIINNTKIYTIIIKNKIKTNFQSFNLKDIKTIKCSHGEEFDFKFINKLPQEGWQELIDCWSCHNCEFKSMLDLKIKPRKNGILVSNFYLLADENAIPSCCKNIAKFSYENLKFDFSDSLFIYNFFEEYFFGKNSLIFQFKNKNYEIKLFYKCLLFIKDFEKSLKIGIKITEKIPDFDVFIPDYYKEKIIENINANKINVLILGYEISFIRNK